MTPQFSESQSPDSPTTPASQRIAPSAADQALMETIGRALRGTGYPALRSVDIEMCGRVVVLWGRVPTYHQKQLAQATAQQIVGIGGVANGIEVACRR